VKCGLLIVELYPSYLQSIEVVLKSKMETEHLINENDEQLSSHEPNLPLLGSAKFQRQLEKKKRKRIQERGEEAISYPHQNHRNISMESIISDEQGRTPSALPDQFLLDFSDTSMADQFLSSYSDEQTRNFSTIQGGSEYCWTLP